MKTYLLIALSFMFFTQLTAQEMLDKTITSDLPYREIPAYPDSFTPENVAARMVDGLGRVSTVITKYLLQTVTGRRVFPIGAKRVSGYQGCSLLMRI